MVGTVYVRVCCFVRYSDRQFVPGLRPGRLADVIHFLFYFIYLFSDT